MPELSPKTKQYQKQRLRSLIVQQPMISTLGMQQHLTKDGLTTPRSCMGWQGSPRIGWEIVDDQLASFRDRATALKEAREAHNSMFQMPSTPVPLNAESGLRNG